MKTLAGKVGLMLGAAHLCAFLVTIAYVFSSSDGQAPLVWSVFAIIDFPISLVYYLVGPTYSSWLGSLDSPVLAQVCYLPHLLHGPLATIWWCLLPRLVMPKRLGGVWV